MVSSSNEILLLDTDIIFLSDYYQSKTVVDSNYLWTSPMQRRMCKSSSTIDAKSSKNPFLLTHLLIQPIAFSIAMFYSKH